ncbi:MAG TPA: M48 family metalloprotease [Verrucomicrobiae bacterium]|jgi:hypothetical protein|nr:M48 family metalloprotease [Verrucomicrobiae bacterium]
MQATTTRSGSVVDAPNGGRSKLTTTLGAAGIIFLFCSFVLVTIPLLAACIVVEWLAGFLGGRFWWAFQARRLFRGHFTVMGVMLRSWHLPRVGETCVPLAPAEAPALFSMLESLCFQKGIRFPPQVFVDIGAGAWVRLRQSGNRVGGVALGLGFDLLAGTRQSELEAVIAHELSHAKLTQRLVRNWLARGLERAVQLSRGLSKLSAPRRGRVPPPSLSRFFLGISDLLAEAAAQRIAAYSRQEEFEADSGAAELVGKEILRDALLKVEALGRFAARLPWHERVAQLQAQTFTPWLVKELAQVKPVPLPELEAHVPDRFSTHPSLRDRVNALPAIQPSLAEAASAPSIHLLAEPENLAEGLIARILETSVEHEERDSRKLRRWARKMRVATEWSAMQKMGGGMALAAGIIGVVAWIIGAGLEMFAPISGVAILGILFYWLGRYREKFTFPVPDFGLLKASWNKERAAAQEEIKELEMALRARVGRKTGPKTESFLAAKGFAALAENDYAKAAAAARLLLARNSQSLPGLLVSAVSSAWLEEAEETSRALAAIQNNFGLRGPSICWAVAWTSMLRGQWARAESLLEQVIDKKPGDPTLLNFRALCQLRRGKIQSAIISARRACTPRPRNREHAKFLVDLLLEGGYMREAQTRLLPLDKEIPFDHDLMLAAIRLGLSLRNFEGGESVGGNFAAEFTLASHGCPTGRILRSGATIRPGRALLSRGVGARLLSGCMPGPGENGGATRKFGRRAPAYIGGAQYATASWQTRLAADGVARAGA